ncbi:MAG TPA: DUF177 domain-containing protein [Syntrophomonadaceae bacterium]|nr:DUF177 domain-containing protein [Syntrophomonadaceae bacterium]
MFIDLKDLKSQLIKIEQYSVETNLSDELLEDLGGRFLEKCKAGLTVERTGRLYLGNGIAETKVQLPCSRCLKNSPYLIKTEFTFSLAESIYESEFTEEETDIMFFHDTRVDIKPIVQEMILLHLPMRMLCRKDCQGLCVICGVDKNNEKCTCKVDEIDPRWEKLKDLQ